MHRSPTRGGRQALIRTFPVPDRIIQMGGTWNRQWPKTWLWAGVCGGSWGRVGAAGALQWARCACVEVEGSHVIIVSQPEAVTDLILKAVHAVS